MLAEIVEKIIKDKDLIDKVSLSAIKILHEKFDIRTTNSLLAIDLDEMLL